MTVLGIHTFYTTRRNPYPVSNTQHSSVNSLIWSRYANFMHAWLISTIDSNWLWSIKFIHRFFDNKIFSIWGVVYWALWDLVAFPPAQRRGRGYLPSLLAEGLFIIYPPSVATVFTSCQYEVSWRQGNEAEHTTGGGQVIHLSAKIKNRRENTNEDVALQSLKGLDTSCTTQNTTVHKFTIKLHG